MPSPVDEAHAAGYSDGEINAYRAPRMADALGAGYSQDEINNYLGIKPPPKFDDDAVRQQITTNLAAARKPVTSFTDALDAGWQMSTTGPIGRGKAPETELSPDAPLSSRMAYKLAEMTGDVPAMMAGFAIGSGMGGAGHGGNRTRCRGRRRCGRHRGGHGAADRAARAP
jgi:hypothetical protein